jgi:hypothetical protein
MSMIVNIIAKELIVTFNETLSSIIEAGIGSFLGALGAAFALYSIELYRSHKSKFKKINHSLLVLIAYIDLLLRIKVQCLIPANDEITHITKSIDDLLNKHGITDKIIPVGAFKQGERLGVEFNKCVLNFMIPDIEITDAIKNLISEHHFEDPTMLYNLITLESRSKLLTSIFIDREDLVIEMRESGQYGFFFMGYSLPNSEKVDSRFIHITDSLIRETDYNLLLTNKIVEEVKKNISTDTPWYARLFIKNKIAYFKIPDEYLKYMPNGKTNS